jgi:hypothetical protein
MSTLPRTAAFSKRHAALRTVSASRALGVLANDWCLAGVVFVVTRAVALIGAYSGVMQATADEPARNKGWLAELALMWDAAWYALLARDGYSYDPSSPGGANVAFAPLYPFLIKAVSNVLSAFSFGWDWGNEQYGVLIGAGLLISNVAFFLALVFLIRLLEPRLGRGGAGLVALGLASLPTAFFFSAMYTEGLFLFLVIASFAVARSDWHWKWLCVGLIGMLAALTRFAGVLLLPVLAVEYLSQQGWRWRKVRADALFLALVPAGMAIYAVYLWWRFGSPFVLNDSMLKGWDHQPSFFLATYWDSVVLLWRSVWAVVPPDHDPVLYYGNGSRLYMVLDLALPLVLLAGAVVARKKLKDSEWLWLTLGIVYPLSTNITFSMARYVLPLWPGLLWLGTLRGRAKLLAAAWIVVSLALLMWCSGIYGNARWIG